MSNSAVLKNDTTCVYMHKTLGLILSIINKNLSHAQKDPYYIIKVRH